MTLTSSATETMVDNQVKAGQEAGVSPSRDSRSEGSGWQVLASSTTVEYFHTGNLADVLSSSPWTAPAEGQRGDAGMENGGGNPLFVPPPEELSVSLYLESDPDHTVLVLAIPRWFSDEEVWEVRSHFSPLLVGQVEHNEKPFVAS